MKRLKQRCPIAAVLLAVPLSVATAWATPQFSGETRQGSRPPDSDVTATYAMGEVSAIDPSGSRLVVAAGSGQVTVQLDGRTEFLRLAPGETTLEKAEPITLAEVGAGDRVLARGKVSADRKSVAARQLIVMSRADIARKQEREREEWRRRSVAGTITAIDSARREI
ncbi:MAG: hypothetical protein HYX74_01855, partial [Acidobacteria bacterium]|nr:hypothetical protein [Acidobacteriota bacterium]